MRSTRLPVKHKPLVMHFTGADSLGGAETVLAALVTGLDPNRWHRTLLHHGEPNVQPLIENVQAHGVETITIPRMPHEVRAKRFWMFVEVLRRHRPTIFHAHLSLPQYSIVALAAAAFARVPIIVATEHLFQSPSSRTSLYVQRLVSNRVDRYIAVSQFVAEQLRDCLGFPESKISTIRNGIILDRYRVQRDSRLYRELTENRGRPVILTVARLHDQKGISYLLDAAAEIPDATFLIVGNGTQRYKYEGAVRARGLNERVRFLGFRDDVPMLLACADLFVLPSLFEGLPLAMLEAMSAGVPVIASAIGGTMEAAVNGETALLVPPASSHELTIAIRTLLDRKDLCDQLVAAARVRVEQQFSATRMVAETDRLYEDLIAHRST